MSDTIQKTICAECGVLVYATFSTTWRASQQAAQALRWHTFQEHYRDSKL